MFPEELAVVIKRRDIDFQIIGSSWLAKNLRAALKSSRSAATSTVSALERSSLPSSSSSTSSTLSPLALSLIETKNILLFDRADDRLYRTPLKPERSSSDTMIFQFGSHGPTEPITPPSEVYPKSTGGFITTDVKNILMNPDVLDKMADFAKKRNRLMLGDWKPILHTECLSHIMRSGTGMK
ncbi:hypothetical protein BCR42DRAFT_25825 [Absidia repens]|uniref:Uncharacterized protein n=1 Tax=Absidia repens TaxID=90262 RepID=A0A1X2IIF6_9FUNG|nr:hypothetical protein BCR42DRAFT_25825 [Absidia repens]